jgi:hypothetical protein
VAKLTVLHVVELIHAVLKLLDDYGFAGEEGFRGELLELLVLDAF